MMLQKKISNNKMKYIEYYWITVYFLSCIPTVVIPCFQDFSSANLVQCSPKNKELFILLTNGEIALLKEIEVAKKKYMKALSFLKHGEKALLKEIEDNEKQHNADFEIMLQILRQAADCCDDLEGKNRVLQEDLKKCKEHGCLEQFKEREQIYQARLEECEKNVLRGIELAREYKDREQIYQANTATLKSDMNTLGVLFVLCALSFFSYFMYVQCAY